MTKSNKLPLLFGAAFLLIVLDLATKWYAIHFWQNNPPFELTFFLDFRYVENRDVAFSLLRWITPGVRKVLILAIGVGMTLLIVWMLFQYAKESIWLGWGLALIFAGAIGNLFDRVFRGYVVDFIHVHFASFSWPVFNIADICISVGVAIIGLALLFDPHTKETQETPEPTNETT